MRIITQRCRCSQHVPHFHATAWRGSCSKNEHVTDARIKKGRRSTRSGHFGQVARQISAPFLFSTSAKGKKGAKTSTISRAFSIAPSSFLLSISLTLLLPPSPPPPPPPPPSANRKTLTLERTHRITRSRSLAANRKTLTSERKRSLSLSLFLFLNRKNLTQERKHSFFSLGGSQKP